MVKGMVGALVNKSLGLGLGFQHYHNVPLGFRLLDLVKTYGLRIFFN